MKLFALGDLHLDGKQNKPMDVFSEKWINHRERIYDNWRDTVAEDDCVLMPGDFCWAMRLEDAADDLFSVASLPGTKLLIRGNHDYWWTSPTKMRTMLPAGMKIIQNDAVDMGRFIACGTRGWTLPGSPDFKTDDIKIFEREAGRLELTLNAAMRFYEADGSKPIILMFHYPPLPENGEDTRFTEIIARYPVKQVVYGHLHAQSCRTAFEEEKNGVSYTLVSADHLDFCPKLIAEYE